MRGRGGTTRPALPEIRRKTRTKRRATAISSTKVAAAIAHTSNGCPVDKGSIFISTRMEFCHSAACHSATDIPTAQTTVATAS